MKTLTPTQRALVQLAESMLVTALLAGLYSVGPIVDGTGPVDWKMVIGAFVLAASFSLAHSVIAYFKPYYPVEATAVETEVNQLEKRYAPQPVNNSPTMTVARPQATGYPNISMNAQPVPTPIVVNPGGNVWGMPGQDVSAMNTASVPAQPKQ